MLKNLLKHFDINFHVLDQIIFFSFSRKTRDMCQIIISYAFRQHKSNQYRARIKNSRKLKSITLNAIKNKSLRKLAKLAQVFHAWMYETLLFLILSIILIVKLHKIGKLLLPFVSRIFHDSTGIMTAGLVNP